MAEDKTFKLNTGAIMPGIGLGSWQSQPGEVGAAVKAAIRAGYKHIDCAHVYGNEKEVGQALTEALKEEGKKREDIFITSKLWSNDHGDVLNGCKTTLENLQLEYLDLYLIHNPCTLPKDMMFPSEPADNKRFLGYDKTRMATTWKGMEDLVEKGLCKAIGISNFSTAKIANLLETAKIVPATNQVELHPFLPQPLLKKFCEDKGILITAFASLGSPGRPNSMQCEADPILMHEPLVKEIAVKRDCTAAQVLIAWGLHYGCPVLPKSTNEKRIKQNLETYKVKLEDEDMEALSKIGKKFRYFKMIIFYREGETIEQYWDGEQ